MEKSKKISFTSIAIVVLAILLTVSLTMGGTLAWFANQNQAGTTLTMGNAVGVAVVDNKDATDSMDNLSFTFHTGANGELMLPGTQIDPNVQALIAKSNTNTILRAVVSFEVSLSNRITAEDIDKIEAAAGSDVYYDTTYQRNFISVPSSVAGDVKGSAVQQELYLLNQMYVSFFETLQASALYNGWVYRESNLFTSDSQVGSTRAASTKYYVSGYTQYQNTAIVAQATRNAGIGRTQQTIADTTTVTNMGYDGDEATGGKVTYNAFYFRGWKGTKTYTVPADTYDASGTGIKYVKYGIDGTYAETYQNGSLVSSKYDGGGVQYYTNRKEVNDKTSSTNSMGTALTAGTPGTTEEEYAILEGVLEGNTITKYADPLGYKAGDPTANGNTDTPAALNVAGAIANTQAANGTYTDYCWATAGAQTAGEDMMCVINSNAGSVLVPLFTTSFILPTSWTQDAFADRTMKLNITFQVMQSSYLASGTSQHVSVELAESRFDDATIWAESADGAYSANAPFVVSVDGSSKYNNPEFWIGDYPYINDDDITGGAGA